MTYDIPSAPLLARANGHAVNQIVAEGEPERHRLAALRDLHAALPTPEDLASAGASIRAVSTTPDFHPGRPVPVGVVIDVEKAVMPHLVGSDIGCGMRLTVLDGVAADDIANAVELEAHLRHVFFQGGRDLAMTGRNRRAILEDGLPGLISSMEGRERRGLLARTDIADLWSELDRTCDGGVFAAGGLEPGFAEYGAMDDDFRRDAILGSIGGGNHFVEIGVADEVTDGAFASACGIRKGAVCLVVHTGSLDFGQRVGSLASLWRDDAVSDHRIIPTVGRGDRMDRYRRAMANAANVAFANRMTIAMAGAMAIGRSIGRDVAGRLVYDAPHNVVWIDPEGVSRHRKGACPARGHAAMAGTPYAYHGEPVILPGSMGDGTWLMVGTGSTATLESSAHGAGRRLSRGEARSKGFVPGALRVVGPVDMGSASLRGRHDVRREAEARLREESPLAYRPLNAVADPLEAAGVARKAVRIRPLLTVKG